jgi:general stress protein YciG
MEVAMADKKTGFAAMTPEKRKELSARGGRAAHRAGTAHVWTQEEAKKAGRLGGKGRKKKVVDEDPGTAPLVPHGT